MLSLIPLSDAEFKLIRTLVYDRFGINLTDQKRSLVVGRLNKILHSLNLSSFRDYYDHVIADKSGQALSNMVNRLSTNHTFFFREADHFHMLLKTVLPELAARNTARGRKLMRLWCAASSSGEEPYTLAMLLNEHFKYAMSEWDTGVLATDISTQVLTIAQNGIYHKNNIAGLPAEYVKRYLTQIDAEDWAIKQQIKDLVLFRRLNLMRAAFPFKGKFQIIFARNVMIYFDEQTRDALVERFHKYLEPGGYLFIGHSESLGRKHKLFRYVKPAVYKKEEI